MIDWSKELEAIFNDPLLADVTVPKKRTTSSDRLIAGFQEICDFYEANGRLPVEATESVLFHRLKGIMDNDTRRERCKPFDKFGILSDGTEKKDTISDEQTKETQIEQILNDPLFSDVTDDDDSGLFDVPEYMKTRLTARKEAEYIGKRVPCEDFEKYADGFKQIQQGLKSGKYRLVKFSEPMLKIGRYFVEQGVVGYLVAFDSEGRNALGRIDGRTRCIYENGSEADIKFRTLTKNLAVDGYIVEDCSEMSDEEFKKHFTLSDNDVESGTIYVLRSKSKRPEIASIKNLYKIGFTVTSVESRIANARKEPTYLCADVDIVVKWKVYNVKSSTFESLIHKLFGNVQLQITIDGHRPEEWFVVPLNVIEEAINNIITGTPIAYDMALQKIIYTH